MKRFNFKFMLQLGMCFLATVALSATANPQRCKLGENCVLPPEDNGDVEYVIQPINGSRYECIATAVSNRLIFWVEGGKNFRLTRGDGYFVSAPSTTITIMGTFVNPNQPYGEGLIVFHRLMGKGNVICYQ